MRLWEHPDLTIQEKYLLINIDSLASSDEGVNAGAQMLASLSGIPLKETREILNSLYKKGAVEIRMNDDGAKLLKPLLYREHYQPLDEKIVVGDKPTDSETLPYVEIQENWAKYCPMLPPISRMTPQRKRKIKSTLKSADLRVEDLYRCFQIISVTPFLNGKSGKFKATFDWCMAKSQNLQKIYEGFYSKSHSEQQAYSSIMTGNIPTPITMDAEENEEYR